MEVDMHSPSFREMQSLSTKRRRSPDGSPTPPERNAKRIFLAPDLESTPSPVFPPFRASSSASTSRLSSEDWVEKTDGLSIDSPLLSGFTQGASQDADSRTAHNAIDESMTTDSDETMGICRPRLNIPRSSYRPHAPHIQITTTSSTHFSPNYQPQQQHQSSFLSAPSQHTYSLSPQNDLSTNPLQPPMIRVLPATPANSPLSTQNHVADTHAHLPNSTSQSSSMSPMAISPAVSPSSNRKQRFTMGPRSDCEKCKLGVKGHWMHID